MLNSCNKINVGAEEPVLMPVKEDPTVSFRIWFKAGSQNDPAGKEGLASLTASLLTEGATKTNSYEQILDKLFPLAASYNSSVDKEMTIISGRTHLDNLEEYYRLFTDAILKPAFNEDDFTRLKNEVISYIENDLRYSSDEELGKALLYDFIFEGTPYGHLSEGTVASLKSINLEDVKNFYKKYYTKENFVIGLGGNYNDKLLNRLEKDLSSLPEGKVAQAAKPTPPKIDGLEVLMVEKECDATAISFGFPIDILRSDKDFVALSVFNSWFGEHQNQSSHLYQVIREKRGMNYGDYSYIETFLNGGALNVPNPNNPRRQQIFEVWIRPVQNHQRHFALRAAMRELRLVVENGLSKEQFELTKNYLYNYSLYYAQTTMAKLGYQIDSRFYGLDDGGDYVAWFRKKLKSLKLEDVNAAIKKHIQFSNIKIAIVTNNAEQLKNDLINDTPSPIQYATPVAPDVPEEDKFIINFPMKVKAEKIRIKKINEVF